MSSLTRGQHCLREPAEAMQSQPLEVTLAPRTRFGDPRSLIWLYLEIVCIYSVVVIKL